MSTISVQCDELRSMAVSVGLKMPQAATLMMDAADTIDSMDKRHAKTFEVGKRWMAKAARFEAENAKLRELCEDMLSCIEIQIAFDRTPKKRMYKEFAGRARELGIEVGE